MSKATFRAECQRIFRPYIPELEAGKLKQHHRDFITRNEDQPAVIRARLIAELRKYDLSGSGLSPQFNRERDVFTEEKLRLIEKASDASST
jgi:hypothetical protein